MKSSARQVAFCAIMVSLALVLSYMERFFPLQLLIPLPGIKLGLANVVTLLGLCFLSKKATFAILALRCVLGSLFGGGMTSLAFSLTGGLLALSVMAALRPVRLFSLYGISIAGAAAHSVGQILAAFVLSGTPGIVYYLPYLLLVSIVTGFLTGAVSAATFRALVAARQMPTGNYSYQTQDTGGSP